MDDIALVDECGVRVTRVVEESKSWVEDSSHSFRGRVRQGMRIDTADDRTQCEGVYRVLDSQREL
jgi:hypothetical protein